MPSEIAGYIAHPSAWLGSEIAHDDAWLYRFTARDLAEIEAALAGLRGRDLPLPAVTRRDFPLPTLGARLEELRHELRDGRGFVALRGLPVKEYGEEAAALAYWGLGLHFGRPVAQDVAGTLMGTVRDTGKRWGELGVRGPDTNGQLSFHTDFSDMVALLCLQKARLGGLSRIASAVTIHNLLLREAPEHLPLLYRGFRYIRREAVESERPVTQPIPVFGYHAGLLSCRLVPERIQAAAQRMETPLSASEQAALDAVAAVARRPEVHLDMDLLPGDIQILNNYVALHSRTAFEDGDAPDERRRLLRLWISFEGERRALPPGFPQSNGYRAPDCPAPPGAVELGLAV